MTNKEYIIACLNDEIDDGGASWESCVHYHINCPYTCGDKRAHCFNHGNDFDFINRENCVACKMEWLESEVDT